jgi:hypothetical protein
MVSRGKTRKTASKRVRPTAVEVLGELRSHAVRLEDTEDLVSGDETDL